MQDALEMRVRSLGWKDPFEKQMATHSSTLAQKIPWTLEPGDPQSLGSQRFRHDWVSDTTTLHLDVDGGFTFTLTFQIQEQGPQGCCLPRMLGPWGPRLGWSDSTAPAQRACPALGHLGLGVNPSKSHQEWSLPRRKVTSVLNDYTLSSLFF